MTAVKADTAALLAKGTVKSVQRGLAQRTDLNVTGGYTPTVVKKSYDIIVAITNPNKTFLSYKVDLIGTNPSWFSASVELQNGKIVLEISIEPVSANPPTLKGYSLDWQVIEFY